jgi:ethanolamine utilization protein EutQ
MAVYSYRSDEVLFDGSNKLADTEVYLKDVVDASISESMTTGLARYAKGVSNEWTLDYDEIIVVLKGVFTIHSEGKSSTSNPGDFFFITRGTSLTYQADEAALVLYVTYPSWREAAPKTGRL